MKTIDNDFIDERKKSRANNDGDGSGDGAGAMEFRYRPRRRLPPGGEEMLATLEAKERGDGDEAYGY